jgi:glycerol uptake facilitator-like aquaporin
MHTSNLKYLVEFLGTAILSLAIFATGNYLFIGATLASMIFLIGNVSGGAFNPAVAIAMYKQGKLAGKDLIPYIAVEIFGAIAGLYVSNLTKM